MTSATSRALALPELLESIILHCEPYSLLQARAVSRYFNEQIAASLKIQQALFLKPCPKLLAYPTSDDQELVSQVYVNPFLLKVENGLICNIVPPEDVGGDDWMDFVLHETFRLKDIGKDATCRRMHFTSPPVLKVELDIIHYRDSNSGKAAKWLPGSIRLTELGQGCYNISGRIDRPDGVLVGDLLDVVEEVGIAGDLRSLYVEMGIEVDDAQRKEINYEGEQYENKALVEVKADDARLMEMRFRVVAVQQKSDVD